MNILLFHGYELAGSGSNEYNRYLARALLKQGHTVHIVCRERHPRAIEFIDQAWFWHTEQNPVRELLHPDAEPACILHRLPDTPFYPVYLTDKQRPGNAIAFTALSDQQLASFKRQNEALLDAILTTTKPDILFANHLVMQPSIAVKPCREHNVPFVIFAHGSAIEYTVRKDKRYLHEAADALAHCQALITGNQEVCDRILALFPEQRHAIEGKHHIVGIGVDTSLFAPVDPGSRRQRLDEFLRSAEGRPQGGKSPALLQVLQQSLQRRDFDVLRTQFCDYNENSVDTDIADKLRRLNPEKPVILYVGALTAGKGLQSLLCAFPLVFAQLHDPQLMIIGSGAYRETLEALVYALQHKDEALLRWLAERGFDLDDSDEHGPWTDILHFLSHRKNLDRLFHHSHQLADKVFFLGRMRHAQLAWLFPCADIAVFPSIVPEAYGLVLMEALANGVLPLVSYFSGFKDGIDELERFLPATLVDSMKISMRPESRLDSIATRLLQLHQAGSEPGLRNRLAAIAAEHYDWNRRALELSTVLRQVKAGDNIKTR